MVDWSSQPRFTEHMSYLPPTDQLFFQPEPSKVIKKRRQYHSCDACRHGRRGCDARDLPAPPCSNCLKADRECRFDWLQGVPLSGAPGKKAKSHNNPTVKGKGQGNRKPTSSSPSTVTSTPASHAMSAQSVGRRASMVSPAVAWSAPSPDYSLLMPLDLSTQLPTQSHIPETINTNATTATAGWTGVLFDQSQYYYPPPSPGEEFSKWTTLVGGHPACPASVAASASDATVEAMPEITPSMSVVPTASKQHRGPHESTYNRPASKSRASPPSSLQGIDNQLSSNNNRMQIADTFVQVYTDSFEHLLSCWVAKSACPYSTPPLCSASDRDLDGYFKPQLRFHEMVCRLHAKFGPLARSFDKTESLEAKRTLQKTIMAFASQWSPHNTSSGSAVKVDLDDGVDDQCSDLLGSSNSFNRIMQESLWHEAHRGIQAMRDTGSFCAILAHIIFALTQQPVAVSGPSTRVLRSKLDARSKSFCDLEQAQAASTPDSTSENGNSSWRSGIAEVLMDADGSPAFLETALRHLHTWRRILARLSICGSQEPAPASIPGVARPRAIPTKEDTEDFSLLFWFGVMCDTTCAAISNRPLIISDDDCARPAGYHDGSISIDPSSGSEQPDDLTPFDKTTRQKSPSLWPLNWGKPGGHSGDCLNGNFRWPCSLADAAVRLRDAAQVKVLLMRRVTALQALIHRPVSAAKFEVAIQDALDVHDSFNATYGRFIQDCTYHHADIPARFQSWYVISGTHWHLGVLLLADVIEALDLSRKSDPQARKSRQDSLFVTQLRTSSAYAIAELSRASCSSRDSTKQYHIDRDFAFNDGAFLSEPWADILVRALARAMTVFLDLISQDMDREAGGRDADNVLACSYYQNAESCIAGLQQLGVKSDLAHLLAAELELRLHKVFDPVMSSGERHCASV
jgi:hypothetical protein